MIGLLEEVIGKYQQKDISLNLLGTKQNTLKHPPSQPLWS
jgi:hypothetical protein